MKNRFLRGDLVLVIILVTAIVSAQYGIPHQFWGTVTDNNGNQAPDGTLIIIKINNQDVAATTTKSGNYGYEPIFYIQDPNKNRDGKKIEFFVNSVKVAESSFRNGATEELNLITSESFGVSPPSNTGGNTGSSGSSGSGGGGGGGGSGSSGGIITKSAPETTCAPSWKCSEWLDCVGTIQKRVCTDVNFCGANENKPEEERSCESEELRETKPFFSRILGAVIGADGRIKPLIPIAFIILILATSLLIVYKRKTRNKSS